MAKVLPVFEGVRSATLWLTIGTVVITSCLTGAYAWGTLVDRANRQDEGIAQVRTETLDAKAAVATRFKSVNERILRENTAINLKLDKHADLMLQIIRVQARIAAKVGVSDE